MKSEENHEETWAAYLKKGKVLTKFKEGDIVYVDGHSESHKKQFVIAELKQGAQTATLETPMRSRLIGLKNPVNLNKLKPFSSLSRIWQPDVKFYDPDRNMGGVILNHQPWYLKDTAILRYEDGFKEVVNGNERLGRLWKEY